MIVSNAPSCVIAYNYHSPHTNDSTGVLESIFTTGVTHDNCHLQWERINCKQIARWQHLSR
jgi:hypothetical protein